MPTSIFIFIDIYSLRWFHL